jgi:DNA-3-methyladenine glycosylase I
MGRSAARRTQALRIPGAGRRAGRAELVYDSPQASQLPRRLPSVRSARGARYDEVKIAALLGDAGIVRNRLKIRSAVGNAQAFLALQKEFGSFDAYVWRFVGGSPLQNRWRRHESVPARTEQSDALSKDLTGRGFRFVGSTICYAFMQATGMVNDHLIGCFRHKDLR